MKFTVEEWSDDGEGSCASSWSGLTEAEAWAHFADWLPAMRLEDQRAFIFHRKRPGANREVVAQAWIDCHGECQVRISTGWSPLVHLRASGL